MIFRKFGQYKKHYIKGRNEGFKIKNFEIDNINRNNQKDKDRMTREFNSRIKKEGDRIRLEERERAKQMLDNERKKNEDLLDRLETQYSHNNNMRKENRKMRSEYNKLIGLKTRLEANLPVIEEVIHGIADERIKLETLKFQKLFDKLDKVSMDIYKINTKEPKLKIING